MYPVTMQTISAERGREMREQAAAWRRSREARSAAHARPGSSLRTGNPRAYGGAKDINTTMGYKAVYPDEVINGHRAFITRRRELRPSDEYRTPTGEEWEAFPGHFERRRLSLGDCGCAAPRRLI